MSSENQTPDLASVMKILKGLNQAQDQQQAQSPAQIATQIPNVGSHGLATQQRQWARPVMHHQSGQSQAVNHQKLVDPSTITDWGAGLRCVMKTAAKHDHVLQKIRKMIKLQHEHEEQWWRGREALIEKQAARKEGQRKLEEVLRAVGGATSNGTSNTSPEELARELETFDMKVYKAQTQMVREMNGELRNLGIPFFGTKSELVRVPGRSDAANGTGANVTEGEKGVIDEEDLVKLQRKMLNILEDLCND
ncbi:hypothetical protein DSL72_008241 [Monilinia vaccinii-corymbosi]|uniref:Uncharacterized protein n=1 Tax=Monilinia vaccinii-corymbosi TaxID=61207 RepID=A0A8A3PK97_9HELO|nr:hypothetical protein DSL72_008241 [Monilinia vaccinii-corymbosi]